MIRNHVFNSLTDNGHKLECDNYNDFMNRMKNHANTVLFQREEFISQLKDTGEIIDDNKTVFRNRYLTGTSDVRFLENPCYKLTFPTPSHNDAWKKEQIYPLVEPPFDRLSFMLGGHSLFEIDARMQSLVQSLNCGGYYKLRIQLSGLFSVLRQKLRKIEADIVVSYIATVHGFQCHCLAKLYCGKCPQSFREILSTMSINEYLPLSIDLRTQWCPFYYQCVFETTKKPLQITSQKRNRKVEAIKAIFFADVYECQEAVEEIMCYAAEECMGQKKYSRSVLQYEEIDCIIKRDKGYYFRLTMPCTRLIVFLPIRVNQKRQTFDQMMFNGGKMERLTDSKGSWLMSDALGRKTITKISYKDSWLMSDSSGDWFQFCLCKDSNTKLIMQSKSALETADITNSFITDPDEENSIHFEPILEDLNAIIYVEKWNAMTSNSFSNCILFA